MIKKEDIVEIGKFQKTHALKGELNALLDVDADFIEDGHPLIIDVDGIYVPFYVDSIRQKGSESFLLKLRDVNSQEAAQEFVNKSIYAARENLVDYFDDPDIEIVADFEGFTVIDSRLGVIGKVVDVDDSTANVLFVIETPDGRTVYVPVAEEFIIAINDEDEIIETSLPDGLVDLND